MTKMKTTAIVALLGFLAIAGTTVAQNTDTHQTVLNYDSATNRIGINTATPSTTLDVSGTMKVGTPQATTPSTAIGTGGLAITNSGTLCYVSGTIWVEVGQKATPCSFAPSR